MAHLLPFGFPGVSSLKAALLWYKLFRIGLSYWLYRVYGWLRKVRARSIENSLPYGVGTSGCDRDICLRASLKSAEISAVISLVVSSLAPVMKRFTELAEGDFNRCSDSKGPNLQSGAFFFVLTAPISVLT